MTKVLFFKSWVGFFAAAAIAGCSDQPTDLPSSVAVETASVALYQMDMPQAEAAASAMLALNADTCTRPNGEFFLWLCSQRVLAGRVLEVNQKRHALSAKLEGAMEVDTFSHDTMDLSNLVVNCLSSSASPTTCLTEAYSEHTNLLNLYEKAQQERSSVAASASVTLPHSTALGNWNPNDYKTMSWAEYKAFQVKLLEESEAYWKKRLPDLVVTSDCPKESSYKDFEYEDSQLLLKAETSCNAEQFRTVISDGDKVRRKLFKVHHYAVAGGCVDAVKLLIEQCVPTYGLGNKPKPTEFEATLTGLDAEDEQEWNQLNSRFDRVLDAVAVYRANDLRPWRGGSTSTVWDAVGSGQPSAVRFAIATGATLDASSSQAPLTHAVAKFRGEGCNKSATIETEHCAGRFEIVKTLVGLGANLNVEDEAYGKVLDQAKKDGSKPIVDFLQWAGASSGQLKATEQPINPAIARCLQQVNRTLNNTVGGDEVIVRQARAIQECYNLEQGSAMGPGSALASVALQAEYSRFADLTMQGNHPNCRLIGLDIQMALSRGDMNSLKIPEMIASSRRHGCV